mmetsp:Transcript_37759/g.106704  ORF Transcript_37759/g.106704 Transcript_37759/m.106704 type:complete len:218 (-) Transcript_37759:103-756(-)
MRLPAGGRLGPAHPSARRQVPCRCSQEAWPPCTSPLSARTLPRCQQPCFQLRSTPDPPACDGASWQQTQSGPGDRCRSRWRGGTLPPCIRRLTLPHGCRVAPASSPIPRCSQCAELLSCGAGCSMTHGCMFWAALKAGIAHVWQLHDICTPGFADSAAHFPRAIRFCGRVRRLQSSKCRPQAAELALPSPCWLEPTVLKVPCCHRPRASTPGDIKGW